MHMDTKDDRSCAGSSKHGLCEKRVEHNCKGPQVVDILLLTDDYISGALFNAKSPSQLTVVQLKRWLAFHDAPISGKNQISMKGDNCMYHL